MNIKELKRQIKNLAFEDDSAIQEYTEIVIDAINRSMMEIVTTVRPILRKLEISITGESAESKYNVADLTMVEGKRVFMGVDSVYLENSKGFQSAASRMEGKDWIILPKSEGIYTIWYRTKPTAITVDTDEKTEMELDLDVQILLPLLCAYYVWLDDDERKAVQYYNKYDALKQEIMAGTQERPTARFV